MTGRRRDAKPPDPLPSERSGASPSGVWLGKGTPVQSGVIWLLRSMPDGQWPPDQSQPRNDTFSWWVRSSCGHQGGIRQWAFYQRKDAEIYEQVFRADPCRYTRCPERLLSEFKRGSKR